MDKYLVLENGNVYKGKAFGHTGDSVGELVFTTAVVGYTETLTDPTYAGEIVMQTFPEIGNYGVMYEDMESDAITAAGYVVSGYCDKPSNFRTDTDIDSFLKEHGTPGLYGIDTRAVTAVIRNAGVMNAAIVSDPAGVDFDKLRGYKINCVAAGTKEEVVYEPEKALFTVVLFDYGVKKSIITNLLKHGCRVIKVPRSTSVQRVRELSPDGIVLSNGPGNPAEYKKEIKAVSALIGYKPIFGIGLGHQLAALATGAKVRKLKYGHRGGNRPVRETATGRTFVVAENHGYTVDINSLKAGVPSYLDANDGSPEGINYPEAGMMTTAFYPEAVAVPKDMKKPFDEFDKLMKGGKR